MDIAIHETMLPHADPEASLAFYRDLLGWHVKNDVGYQDMRWITVAPTAESFTSIVLYPPQATPGISDDEKRLIEEMMAKGTFASVNLATHDLDGLWEKLEASGAEIVQEPTDQPYGIRDSSVRDPSGNLLRIKQLT